MKKSFLLGAILIMVLVGASWLHIRWDDWEKTARETVSLAREAGTDADKWQDIFSRARSLPPVYPFSLMRSGVGSLEDLWLQKTRLEELLTMIEGDHLTREQVQDVFSVLERVESDMQIIERTIERLPVGWMTPEQISLREKAAHRVQQALFVLSEIRNAEDIVDRFMTDNHRVLFLLQNDNEPRSSGGFVGSLMLVDFSSDGVAWRFEDIYALDRLVSLDKQITAPEFFQSLAPAISLRDANFFPHFPDTAKAYQSFFSAIEYTPPKTVIAINLEFIRTVMAYFDPIVLSEWGVTLDSRNFDLALSFLVESKIAGRYDVKRPVMEFAKGLLAQLPTIDIRRLVELDIEELIASKSVLAWSQDRDLQRWFRLWGVTGEVAFDSDIDNGLYFDFISIGGNKTEKFLWTKINHQSHLQSNGQVRNTLEITRNHALHAGELDSILHREGWFPNVATLLDDVDLRWTLAEGQNRTMIRIYVPPSARRVSGTSPSGEVTFAQTSDGEFGVIEVPIFVVPGERNTARIEYMTPYSVGRYSLQLIGTPARRQTEFLSTVSTEIGEFDAETLTIGKPLPLRDEFFRVVTN